MVCPSLSPPYLLLIMFFPFSVSRKRWKSRSRTVGRNTHSSLQVDQGRSVCFSFTSFAVVPGFEFFTHRILF